MGQDATRERAQRRREDILAHFRAMVERSGSVDEWDSAESMRDKLNRGGWLTTIETTARDMEALTKKGALVKAPRVFGASPGWRLLKVELEPMTAAVRAEGAKAPGNRGREDG